MMFNQSFIDELTEKICDRLKPEFQNFAPLQPPQPEELKTSKQTAKRLQVSLPTLHKWKLEGRIKFYRIGSRVRFKDSDITSALQTFSNKKGGRNGK